MRTSYVTDANEAFQIFIDLCGESHPSWSRDDVARWLDHNGFVFYDNGAHLGRHGQIIPRDYVTTDTIRSAVKAYWDAFAGEPES